MTRVWPALCPPWKRNDHGGPIGELIDDLALAFVSPLHAYDGNRIGHSNPPVFPGDGPRSIPPSPTTTHRPPRRSRRRGAACGFTRQALNDALSVRSELADRGEQPWSVGPWRGDHVFIHRLSAGCLQGDERLQVRAESGGRPRAPEDTADLVVAPTPGHFPSVSRHERGKDESGVVAVSAQLGQVHVQLHVGTARAHRVHQRGKIRQPAFDLPAAALELTRSTLQDRRGAIQVDERGQCGGAPRLDPPDVQQLPDLRPGLALQCLVQDGLPLVRQGGAARERTEDPDMAHVEIHRPDPGRVQRFEHQADDLAIALPACMAVELRPDLHRAAPARDAFRQGVQNGPDVAQARRTGAAQAAGVDAGHLGGHVRADPHHPARQLIDQLEGMKLQILAGARQQRLQVLDERRGDDLVAAAIEQIEQRTPCPLETQRLRRHQLLHAFRQQPAFRTRLHGAGSCSDRKETGGAPAQRTA